MPLYNKKLGQKGEEISAQYLQKKGIEVIEFNYHTRYGEIDLIARDAKEIVFVETLPKNTMGKVLNEEVKKFF